jgi:hypothetical protein
MCLEGEAKVVLSCKQAWDMTPELLDPSLLSPNLLNLLHCHPRLLLLDVDAVPLLHSHSVVFRLWLDATVHRHRKLA